MVGVAGRSKGCNTCRKRKKGCDLARPACGQCTKSGKVCGGYQRELTFIHHKDSEDNRTLQSGSIVSPEQETSSPHHVIRSVAASSKANSSLSFTAYQQSPDVSADLVWPETSALVQQRSSPSASMQLLPPSLSLTALTTLHTSLFNSLYLPRDIRPSQGSFWAFGNHVNWTLIAAQLLNNDRGLQLAYLALSCSRVGHHNQDDNLLESGKTLYGKALREMQHAIVDPRRRYSEEILLACSALSQYEMVEVQPPRNGPVSSTPNGWFSHAAGVAGLLEARGPDAYTTDKAHQVFLNARFVIAIRASTARKACCLSEPQWLTVPWRNHPKDRRHKLIDVMVFLPTVLESYDRVELDSSLDPRGIHRERRLLLARCFDLDEQLRSWYAQLCAEMKGRPLWQTSEPADPSYPFPHLFSFDDHLAAHTIMLYWTCCLVIHRVMRRLEYYMNEDVGNGKEAVTLPNHIDPYSNAFNIAQSLPYLLHPDMGALGPNLAVFSAGMALGFFATPTQPPFTVDWDTMRSFSSLMEGRSTGECPRISQTAMATVLWLAKQLKDLSSRSMPGGAFLSSLMRTVQDAKVQTGARSVSAV